MKKEIIPPNKGNPLRKNISKELEIIIDDEFLEDIYMIIGNSFTTQEITKKDLNINSENYFMIINTGEKEIPIYYSEDLDEMEIIYDPYKYEDSEKVNLKQEYLEKTFEIPPGYIDILPKWYSFKFTYPDYNLIFLKPELGISIQTHESRNELWEVISGEPIILNGNNVYYNVKDSTTFEVPKNTFHTIINPHKDPNKFVIIKERWSGNFDEEDIERVYNPNNFG